MAIHEGFTGASIPEGNIGVSDVAASAPSAGGEERQAVMLGWALTFFIIAVIAALFGFTGIAGTMAWIAQVLFFLFIVLFVIALITGAARGRTPRTM